jgi:putative membrane protein
MNPMFWTGPHAGWQGDGGLWWIGFPIAWLVFLIIVGILTWLVLRATRRGSGESATAAGKRILAERFARGEIDEEEYHSRLSRLPGS